LRLRWPPPPRHRYPSPVRAIRALSSILRTIVGPICMRCASGPCPPPRAFAMYDSAHLSRGGLRFAPSACRLVASSYDCTTVRRRFPAVIMLGETSARLSGRFVAASPIISSALCCRSSLSALPGAALLPSPAPSSSPAPTLPPFRAVASASASVTSDASSPLSTAQLCRTLWCFSFASPLSSVALRFPASPPRASAASPDSLPPPSCPSSSLHRRRGRALVRHHLRHWHSCAVSWSCHAPSQAAKRKVYRYRHRSGSKC